MFLVVPSESQRLADDEKLVWAKKEDYVNRQLQLTLNCCAFEQLRIAIAVRVNGYCLDACFYSLKGESIFTLSGAL